ncbi:arabinose efflux permease family protein [Halovivax ruber XH-70]|uniref:Arabinose efflux permease family protein n=1 Tax=Halovivax ruber (strain DSM 18193 / JCM 13892 / XH-70) TaxID=797302 RepID=L0IFH6_HALRX|nr:MFS transporter [Halovivax ruber]AGB17598.1 arabinose efflux permease family protein [Halovivax ruber XH-70]
MDVRETLTTEARALWADGRGPSLAVVASTWGLFVGARMILPVLLPDLQDAYGLSLSVASLLVSVLWLFAAVGQLPGGLLADRYSERAVMATGATIVAVALGLVVTAPTPIVLFAAVAVWGLGHSMYPIARITVLSKLYPDRLGSALGVTMATGDVGQTILPPIAVAVAAAVAWQAGLGFVAPLLLVGALALFVAVPATGPEAMDGQSTATDDDGPHSTDAPAATDGTGADSDEGVLRETLAVFGELRDPSLGFMTVILFLYIFIWQSVTALYPTYLETVKGLSPATTSLLFGFFFAVGVVVKPVAGAAYDRIGMRGALVAVLAPPAVGLAILPFVSGLWLLVPTTALISTMLGSGAVTQSFIADAFTEERKGTGLGVVRTTTATLGAAGPVVFGVLGDNGYFDEGYLLLAAIMAAVVGLTLVMPETDTDAN